MNSLILFFLLLVFIYSKTITSTILVGPKSQFVTENPGQIFQDNDCQKQNLKISSKSNKNINKQKILKPQIDNRSCKNQVQTTVQTLKTFSILPPQTVQYTTAKFSQKISTSSSPSSSINTIEKKNNLSNSKSYAQDRASINNAQQNVKQQSGSKIIKQQQNLIVGVNDNVIGKDNIVLGDSNNLNGNNNGLYGKNNNVLGNINLVKGNKNEVCGSGNIIV